MKTFKQRIAEVAEPNNEDELNFKEKHAAEVIDHPASHEHQHTSDKRRSKRRADYEQGEDEDVYEAKELDQVGQEDGDIDNDGDKDDSDDYLHARRRAITKAMKKESKLDPVGKADADIDNDGDTDSSDEYLHARRKAIAKAMKKESHSLFEKAVSQAQQQAAGVALAVKRGEKSKSALVGASKEMYKMSEKDLEDFARTKHKGLPQKVEEASADDYEKVRSALPSSMDVGKWYPIKNGFEAQVSDRGSYTLRRKVKVAGETRFEKFSLTRSGGLKSLGYARILEEANASKIIASINAGDSIDVTVQKNLNKRGDNKDEILKVIRDYNWKKRMKKEAVSLGEGSGPKEKQKSPYRDISSPEYRTSADKQIQQMKKDQAAKSGKELLAKIAMKKEEVDLDEAAPTQKQIIRALQGMKVQPKEKVTLKKAPWDEKKESVAEAQKSIYDLNMEYFKLTGKKAPAGTSKQAMQVIIDKIKRDEIKESEQVNEVSKNKLKDYMNAARKDMRNRYYDDEDESNKKFANRSKGIEKALDKRDANSKVKVPATESVNYLEERPDSATEAIKEIASMTATNPSVVGPALEAGGLDPLSVLTAMKGRKTIKPLQLSYFIMGHAFGGKINKTELAAIKKAADSAFASPSKKKVTEETMLEDVTLDKNRDILTKKNDGTKVVKDLSEETDLTENFKAGAVKLNDGSSVIVKEADANLMNQLFKELSGANRDAMMKTAMKDKKGFNEILSFAKQAL